ncbi:hypothetical protein SO802_022482 [Lithocarpus litseifolius]|uniref:Uncharacterized protein n=1 Tax=Lithocarpus litseifolius TaxID=425828 RepID=A0AAW2C736_9ROSI
MFPSSTHSSGDLCGSELRCVVWWRFRQVKMEEGGSFCLRGVGFFNSFSRTALANSVVVSSGVWCGGGLGKQRWKRERAVAECIGWRKTLVLRQA